MMKTTIETITPDIASRYLENNSRNRPIRQRHVNFLADEIKAGRWQENGATIVFNGNDLLDGQHRLWAVVTAGVPIKTLVVRDVEKKSFETMDTGLNRTSGDVLSILGHKNGSTISAASRWCISYSNKSLLNWHKLSNTQIVEFVEKNPAILKSANFILNISDGDRWLVSSALAIALHCLMSRKEQLLADDLFSGLKTGFSDQSPEPFRNLRERLIAMSLSQKHLGRIVPAVYIIKAWNAARKSQSLKVFKWQESEDVPTIG